MTKEMIRAQSADFPCASLADSLRHLRRPPTPDAVRFKIQTVAGEVAQVAPYVDARLVFDRLDLVCGERAAPWQTGLYGRLRSQGRLSCATGTGRLCG